jgi:MerR family transcriptional regulator, light-induced transcriptional regulator
MTHDPARVPEATYSEYVEHLLAGNRTACRRIARALADAGCPLRVIYERLVQDSLYEVGYRWETGQVSVATEHLATAISEDLLADIFPLAVRRPPNGRTAIVSCAADEFHQVGGRIVADSLECEGWNCHFLGAGTPDDVLVDAVRSKSPDLVAVSVSVEDHLPNAARAIGKVRAIAAAVPVVLGGRGAGAGADAIAATTPGVFVVRSLATLDAWLRERFA